MKKAAWVIVIVAVAIFSIGNPDVIAGGVKGANILDWPIELQPEPGKRYRHRVGLLGRRAGGHFWRLHRRHHRRLHRLPGPTLRADGLVDQRARGVCPIAGQL